MRLNILWRCILMTIYGIHKNLVSMTTQVKDGFTKLIFCNPRVEIYNLPYKMSLLRMTSWTITFTMNEASPLLNFHPKRWLFNLGFCNPRAKIHKTILKKNTWKLNDATLTWHRKKENNDIWKWCPLKSISVFCKRTHLISLPQ